MSGHVILMIVLSLTSLIGVLGWLRLIRKISKPKLLQNRIVKIVTSMLVGIVVGNGTWLLLAAYYQYTAKKYYEEVNDKSPIYIYHSIGEVDYLALYIQYLHNKEDLVKYHQEVEEAGSPLGIIIPNSVSNQELWYMPKYSPAYFLGYVNENPDLAKVVVFNTNCWGYFEGYIVASAIHEQPPSQTRSIDTNSNRDETARKIYGRPSIYGFYCN